MNKTFSILNLKVDLLTCYYICSFSHSVLFLDIRLSLYGRITAVTFDLFQNNEFYLISLHGATFSFGCTCFFFFFSNIGGIIKTTGCKSKEIIIGYCKQNSAKEYSVYNPKGMIHTVVTLSYRDCVSGL